MTRIPADVYKLVGTARKPTDTGRMLAAAGLSPKMPLVTLAMGEIGFPTRVLRRPSAPSSPMPRPLHAQGTAAGQVNARQLRSLYRIEKFTRAAKIYGVVADPVRHSVSPQVHNRAFQSRRIDAVYVPLLVNPNQLRDFFRCRRSLPLRVSASPFRTSRRSCAISIRWIRWPAASARSTRCGASRQMARHEHRRRSRHRAAFASCCGSESHGADRRQRRRGPRRRLRPGRSRRERSRSRGATPTGCARWPGLRRRSHVARAG